MLTTDTGKEGLMSGTGANRYVEFTPLSLHPRLCNVSHVAGHFGAIIRL
jgi:hypothetical protein